MASHALFVEGRVWVVDPIDGEGVDERVRALGEPAGGIPLLDPAPRDCAGLARRLRVPHHVVPFVDVGAFEAIPLLKRSQWQEAALWWPERRVLVCADALGAGAHYFALGG